jgi:hypothetical protein
MTRMTRTRIQISEVLEHLGARPDTLDRLRDEGLFEADRIDSAEADDLRVATILVEELGVNVAGVQVALHLRRRLVAVEARVARVAPQPEETPSENGDRQ